MSDEQDATEAPDERTEGERRARRRRLTLMLIPVVFFTVASVIANIAGPNLVHSHPVVLIFFAPINRWLLATVGRVDPVVFYSVSIFRLLLTDPIFFVIGRWYGDGALDWIEQNTGNSGTIPFVKKWFGRAGPAFVFLAPNQYVCLLAGSSGMGVVQFASLNITGTVVRLIFIKQIADVAKPILDPTLRFVHHYQWWLVAFSLVTVVLQQLLNRKTGGKGELRAVGTLVDELEASIEKTEGE